MLRKFSRIIVMLIVALSGSLVSLHVTDVHADVDGHFEYLDLGSGTARITAYTGPGGDVIIPDRVGGGLTVLEIGVGAFQYKGLISVTIPDGVTTIGSSAFRDNELTTVNIPDSVTTISDSAFRGNQLISVNIPDGVTTIGNYAFNQNQLTSVNIPDGVTTIGEFAFSNNQLTSVNIPDGVTTIGDFAFNHNQLISVNIPDSVTMISDSAFRGNQLISVNIPDSVTTIGDFAFNHNQLISVNIPDSVTTIGDYAFRQNQLSSITIPSSVDSIGPYAFVDNPSLSDVLVLSPTVNFEDNYIFSNLDNLTLYGFDSSTTQAYASDNGIHFQEVTPELADLELNIGGFAFDPAERNFHVTTNENTVIVTPTAVVPFSEVKVNGELVAYGEDSLPINLSEGTETIIAEVKAPDGSTDTYTIGLYVDHSDPVIDLKTHSSIPTKGNVIVTVDTDGTGSAIEIVKWATGNQVEAFFATGGQLLTGDSFEVSSNGTFTVYARDEAGNEAVQTIEVTNIDRSLPTIDLLASPTSWTNGNVTVTVAVYANSGISDLKWTSGNEGVAFFATDGESLTGDRFTVTSNGTFTVYARDEAGNEAVQTIEVTNIDRSLPTIDLLASPISLTSGSVTVTVAVYANSGISDLKWASGTEAPVFFVTGGQLLTGDSFEVTSNGTYTVYARDHAGNEAVETITISNIERRSSTPTFIPYRDSDSRTIIKVDPEAIIIEVGSRDIKEVTEEGWAKEVVDLPDDVWKEVLKLVDEEDRSVIQMIIDDQLSDVEVKFPSKWLIETRDVHPNIAFDVQLNGSSFQLKANVLDLQQLSKQLGIAVDDIQVIIKTSTITGDIKERFIQAAEAQGMSLISQLINFQLIVSGSDEWVEITNFGGTYLTKSIVLDEQFAKRNYLAVLYDPDDQTFTYVPAIIARRSNGQQDTLIQLSHNSIYAIVESDRIEFADLQGHWAQSEVESLGSKRIVQGITPDEYAPDRNITRAEFISLLVRALGIKTNRSATGDVFEDVSATSWYSAEVEAAFKSGLVNGVNATHFAPDDQITREQMAVMLMNAWSLVNAEAKVIPSTIDTLAPYSDAAEVSDWAQEALSEAVALKFIQGEDIDRLAPTAPATRAQAAVMLHRLLVMINFLDG